MKQCGPDTVYYAYAKASDLRGLYINTTNSADKVSQWFDVPQQMMLHGFSFFAWQSFGSNDTVTLTCKAVLAGSDSLPTGPVIAATSVQVDSTYGNGTLALLEKRAIFSNPVFVDYPFALVVETASPINVAVVTSAWDSSDGGMEWLGSANIPGVGWLHGYEVEVNGIPFDADFIFQPIVSYTIDASFTADTNCLFNGGTVTFDNTTADSVLFSKFYNQYIFNGTPNLIYTWDYDDGSPLELVEDNSHTFPPGSDFDVRLHENIVGWTSICQESFTIRINAATNADFSYAANGLNVTFTNLSTNVDSAYWNFGDGQTSTNLNPLHTFPSEANYNVTLIVFGPCQGDTLKTLISLCAPLSSDFNYTSSGAAVSFSVAAVSGSASFFWDFGDGGFGSGISTTHTFVTSGAYEVCLIASNSCESDTTCNTVQVNVTGLGNLNPLLEMMIFPNPMDDLLTIQFNNEKFIAADINFIDCMGKTVGSWERATESVMKINTEGLQNGVYWLRIKTKEGIATRQIIISE
ncbi:MAG TPA: PKD domain-containing protein [Chitinophagales bacterium]|nr:PKD domain-containing protein [Chitinophagales bacterium]